MSSESNPLRPGGNSKRLDFSAIWRSALAPFIVWVAVVIILVFVRRQPGVICITPLAWVMACWVGMACVARSRSAQRSARLTEAALAGGLLGLLQGLLFIVIMPVMGEVKPEERQKAVLLGVAMIVIGVVVSALLSLAVGAGQDRRRTAK